MRIINQLVWAVILLCFTLVSTVVAQDRNAPQSQRAVLVGRISHVTGQLLRYVPAEKDWVATVKDAPFGLDDALYSGANSKAEFIMPNSTWMRIGDDTQIQLITLADDVTEADVAAGIARFYNRGATTVIKATTPFGYVLAPPETSFDLYVGDQSLEVIALQGKVDFIHASGDAKYEVIAGAPSILADSRQVSSGEGTVDANWNGWNIDRDNLWDKRLQVKGDSVTYLPAQLHDEAYVLEENGRWEQVYYEGTPRRFWRPTRVRPDWAPFTDGRWTVWYDDNCWVPEEPFGYVTHHYGNWVYVDNGWYWAPPVARVGVAVGPVLDVGIGWYPGRVSWIHSETYVGWVPLAPSEPYYSHRYWGPRSLVVAEVGLVAVATGVAAYSYFHHAVVVNQTKLYGVTNYNSVRVTNVTNFNNFRAAPVINNTVVNNYNNIPSRYNFTTAAVTQKPHDIVTQRISYNERVSKQSAALTAQAAQQQSIAVKPATPTQGAQVQIPVGSNKLVPANSFRNPKVDGNFPSKDLKGKDAVKPVSTQPGRTIPGSLPEHPGPATQTTQPGQPSQTGTGVRPPRPGEVQPTQPGQTTQPGQPAQTGTGVRPPRPGEVQPTQPGQTTQPGQPAQTGTGVRPPRPGEVQPAQPGQTIQPGQPSQTGTGVRPPRPGEVQPAQPGQTIQPGQPAQTGTRVRPPKPTRPGEVQPAQPGQTIQPGQPAQTGTGVRPPKPTRPGEVQPAQPGQTIQPGQPAQTGTGRGKDRTVTPEPQGQQRPQVQQPPAQQRPQVQQPPAQQRPQVQQPPAQQRPQVQQPPAQQRPQVQQPPAQQKPHVQPQEQKQQPQQQQKGKAKTPQELEQEQQQKR